MKLTLKSSEFTGLVLEDDDGEIYELREDYGNWVLSYSEADDGEDVYFTREGLLAFAKAVIEGLGKDS